MPTPHASVSASCGHIHRLSTMHSIPDLDHSTSTSLDAGQPPQLNIFSYAQGRRWQHVWTGAAHIHREGRGGALFPQVELDKDRVVPLANFRGSVRPVLLAGSQGYLNRALKASELFRTELRARGISLIPIALTSKDPGEKLAALKREFRCAGLAVSSCAHNVLPSLCSPQNLL